MTDLKKTVRRRSMDIVPAVRKRIIVSLEVGDVISFREEGRRKVYSAPISKVFCTVARWNADAELAKRRAEQKERRKNRGR
jgi:hypothetical protein